jgi:hypothetical protein
VYRESDISSLFGTSESKRILARNLGGKSGQKGSRFEDFFATYKLAEQLSKSYRKGMFADRSRTTVHSQLLAFVDDVIVQRRKTRSAWHYQLKNAAIVSWDAGSPSLADDFDRQRRLCRHTGVNGRSYLVVSSGILRQKLDNERIAKQISCNGVLEFPFVNFDVLVQTWLPFRSALICISPFTFSDVQSDKLRALANIILGAWVSAPNELSISELAHALERTPTAFARPLAGTAKLPVDVRAIFRRIPGFRFKVRKGFLFWSCGPVDNGIYPFSMRTKEFGNLIKRLRKTRPRCFEDIEEQLV